MTRVLLVMAWLSMACDGSVEHARIETTTGVGMALSAPVEGGGDWRLLGATLIVRDTSDVIVEEIDSDDSTTTIIPLDAGDYTIELVGPWSLKLVYDGMAFGRDQYVLESANPQPFSVETGEVTLVTWRFAHAAP